MLFSSNKTKAFAKRIAEQRPDASARIEGSPKYPRIKGKVSFYSVEGGTLVVAEVNNLPYEKGPCGASVHGFHVHEGESCTGNEADPFADTGGHYNPDKCPHPMHAGDMPPLFSNEGFAWGAFYTDRFKVKDIIGRTVIIHEKPDDFTTQPSGNSGAKIACGVIRARPM